MNSSSATQRHRGQDHPTAAVGGQKKPYQGIRLGRVGFTYSHAIGNPPRRRRGIMRSFTRGIGDYPYISLGRLRHRLVVTRIYDLPWDITLSARLHRPRRRR